MAGQDTVSGGSREFLGSAMWRRGAVPIATFGMRLTLTDHGLTLRPRSMVYRVLWTMLRAPNLSVLWDEVASVGTVTGLSVLPPEGVLFELRSPRDSFVFATWRKNETMLETVAAHRVPVARSPRRFNPWRSTSWKNS
jgi:hypothetical protein